MPKFLTTYFTAISPASVCSKNVLLHIVFRLSFLVLGVFIANETGKIVSLLSKGAAFEELLRVWYGVLIAISAVAALTFLIIILKGAWPHVDSRLVMEIRRRVFDTYLRKEVSILEATGKTVGLFESGIAAWNRMVAILLLELPINAIAFAIVFVYLFVTQPKLFPIILAYVSVVWFAMWIMQRYIEPLRKSRVALFEGRSRSFVRTVMERRTVFMYGAVADETANLLKWENRLVDVNDALARLRVPLYRLPQILLDAVKVGVVLTTSYFVLTGGADIASVVSASIAFAMLDKNFQGFIDALQELSDVQTQYFRLHDYLSTLPDFLRYREGAAYRPKKGEIVFDRVDFSYAEGAERAIENFSYVFRGGKKTAIVGKSGAGKSTLVKLLLGIEKATSGKVEVDGQDVSNLRLDSYFPHVGYLPQEPSVFDGTIRENLRYGMSREVSEKELLAALGHARCDFVTNMKDGLETEIGERGIRLSGGERQRLAIARIFLRNPEILVLDEPTSALDSFSEAAVTEALHELFAGKTVIVVAHRLQTVKEADSILVIGEGGILEEGTHAELVAIGGEYSKMVELQGTKGEGKENETLHGDSD